MRVFSINVENQLQCAAEFVFKALNDLFIFILIVFIAVENIPCIDVKALSHDPILRFRFLVPKIGRSRSDGPISRPRFCGENVGRSFVVCSHDPVFRTDKEFSIWRTGISCKIFVGAFHLLRRLSDENRACSISICLFKLADPCVGRSFSMCSDDLIFGTSKNQILKNGSRELAFNQQS